ncbi:MAG: hypothetical protein FGM54_05620 [Chitinophagaceae bacterium]|nr:hypothetical protein [Chitinophagaceae bacterium]
MRFFFLAAIALMAFGARAQNDFSLTIDGKTIELSTDQPGMMMIGGKSYSVSLKQKDTLTFVNTLYSFNYPKDFKVNKKELGNDIDQVMLMTAEGSGVLVQQYKTMSPTALNELMLTELTKESISYGYTMERKDYDKTLASGQKVRVCRAELTYKDDKNIYEIATWGGKDEGILMMSMIMDEELGSQGRKIIDLMWNTIRITKK